MSDECLRSQQVLSEASDGLPVSAEELRNAKAHCAACDECLAYVSGLAALKKSPAPKAPVGLADQVITAVVEDAEEAKAAAAAAAALLAAQTTQAVEVDENGTVTPSAEAAPRKDAGPYSWKAWAPWAGAAAVLLVVAGFAVMQGARFIAGGGNEASVEYLDSASSMESAPPYEVESQADEEADTTRTTQEGAENAEYIDYGGWAYEFMRDGGTPSDLVTAGVVLTSLDTDEPTSQYPIYEGPRPYSLLLYDGQRYLEFDLVRRSSQGRQHAMTVSPVSSFGQWPLPPSGLRMPTHADGSPVFSKGSLDDHGQFMYVPDATYPREGFAIAPGTTSGDPAGGNPNWTWWEPID